MVFSIVGVGFAYTGSYEYALVLLMIAAIINVYSVDVSYPYDPSDAQLSFGLELAISADFITFGLLPACLLLSTTKGNIWGLLTLTIYLLAVAIRLAHFNRSSEFQAVEVDDEVWYLGLPLISVALVLPLVFLLHYFVNESIFSVLLLIVLLGLAVGFVLAKPIPRLSKENLLYATIGVVSLVVVYLLIGIF